MTDATPSGNPQVYAQFCRAPLERRGVPLRRLLGSGAYGSVWSTDGGDIVKLTADTDEARFAAWLRRQGKPPTMLPRIRGVWELDCARRADLAPAYAIRREALKAAPVWLEHTITMIGEALSRPASRDVRRCPDRRIVEALYEIRVVEERRPSAAGLLDATVELFEWASGNSVVMDDLHSDNFGVRTGSAIPVIRDLGFSDKPRLRTVAVPLRGAFDYLTGPR